MERRLFLERGIGITAWITPIITAVSLPAHAATSIPCRVPLVVHEVRGEDKDIDTSGMTPETGSGVFTKKATLDDLGKCSADGSPMSSVYETIYTISDGIPRTIHIETYAEIYCGGHLSSTLRQNYNGTEPYPQSPNFWIGSYTLVVTSCPVES